MQNVQSRRRRRCTLTVRATGDFGGGKRMVVGLQDGDRRRIQPKLNLRAINLTLLRRHIDANASAMEFAGRVGWLALFVCMMMVLTATDRDRRFMARHSVVLRTVDCVVPATTPKNVRDEGRRRQEGH
jgi:hypothetical protein